ncbi:MAG TPA: hypothetical protein VF690_01580 [Hymenobacter sp.]|jgi:hypothetical protein
MQNSIEEYPLFSRRQHEFHFNANLFLKLLSAMKIFLMQWWKLIVGLIAGYALGTVVMWSWKLDYKMLLAYLTAFLSFPTALILIFIILITTYKEEFRKLFLRMQGLKGMGFDVAFGLIEETLKEQKETIIEAAVAATTEPEQKEIEQLETGPARDKRTEQMLQHIDELRERISTTVEHSLPSSLLWPTFQAHIIKNGEEVEELTTKIQRPVSLYLRRNGILPVVGKTNEQAERVNKIWQRHRLQCIDSIIKAMPAYAARYGMSAIAAAVDKAHEAYINGSSTESMLFGAG